MSSHPRGHVLLLRHREVVLVEVVPTQNDVTPAQAFSPAVEIAAFDAGTVPAMAAHGHGAATVLTALPEIPAGTAPNAAENAGAVFEPALFVVVRGPPDLHPSVGVDESA